MTKPVPVLVWLFMLLGTGCSTSRIVTIRTDPPDAQIRVEGAAPVRGRITQQFTFDTPTRTYRVDASREGYGVKFDTITQDDPRTEIVLTLKPQTRRVDILIEPVPAFVRIDGKEISDTPVTVISHELEMGVDPKTNIPVTHEIVATQKNFQEARLKVSRADNTLIYNLKLLPLTKPITVTTEPPGAQLYLDDTLIGTAPLKDFPVEFPADFKTYDIHERILKARKPGYDEKEVVLNWDNGQATYSINFAAKRKLVRIHTVPEDAKVFIDGNEIASGAGTTLEFPPINDKGELKTYTATVSKKADDSEWETQPLQIGWDNERRDYTVTLNEIRARQIPLLVANIKRGDGGWDVSPESVPTQSMRDTKEPGGRAVPQRIYAVSKGYQLGPLTISPDGSQVLFTTMSVSSEADARSAFRSQINIVQADGKQEPQMITRGDALDIMPCFTPGGDQIVFASNRGGRKLNIWRISAKGEGVATWLTRGDSSDLWPSIDSDPRPRLFYQTMIDTRPDPRIYVVQLGTQLPTDLVSGSQPRVAPTNDSILFWVKNDSNDNRDIYRISDKGGAADNLSNTPDADEYDAIWSKDGRRVVFASNRASDESGRKNYDIWMVDLSKPEQAIQLTANGSHDDSPMFDLSGTNVYFRSNRGGEWGIWKIAVSR